MILLRQDVDPNLTVQCDVFEEELAADNEALEDLREQSLVNIQDPKALFDAIDKKVEKCKLFELIFLNCWAILI